MFLYYTRRTRDNSLHQPLMMAIIATGLPWLQAIVHDTDHFPLPNCSLSSYNLFFSNSTFISLFDNQHAERALSSLLDTCLMHSYLPIPCSFSCQTYSVQ